jgi:elongation factor 1-beta
MIMGEVVATIKVMPISPETDLEQLKADIEANIPDDAEFHKIDEEPIAFGLVALNTMVIVDDGEGGTESTEAALDNLENVESIQVTDVRRLM